MPIEHVVSARMLWAGVGFSVALWRRGYGVAAEDGAEVVCEPTDDEFAIHVGQVDELAFSLGVFLPDDFGVGAFEVEEDGHGVVLAIA